MVDALLLLRAFSPAEVECSDSRPFGLPSAASVELSSISAAGGRTLEVVSERVASDASFSEKSRLRCVVVMRRISFSDGMQFFSN